ncbi:hypothetical protein ABG768_003326, partial [Culter alburnus]
MDRGERAAERTGGEMRERPDHPGLSLRGSTRSWLQVVSKGSTVQIPPGDSRPDPVGMRSGHVPAHFS